MQSIKVSPEGVAKLFHEAYEELAPSFGYETREASRKPWEQVPEQNQRLMTAVAARVLGVLRPDEDLYLLQAVHAFFTGTGGYDDTYLNDDELEDGARLRKQVEARLEALSGVELVGGPKRREPTWLPSKGDVVYAVEGGRTVRFEVLAIELDVAEVDPELGSGPGVECYVDGASGERARVVMSLQSWRGRFVGVV